MIRDYLPAIVFVVLGAALGLVFATVNSLAGPKPRHRRRATDEPYESGLPSEVSVQTSRWGSRTELVEVLSLAARGRIQPITTTYGLDEAVAAYADLRDGRVVGRAVIWP